jgi:hypothetical protein
MQQQRAVFCAWSVPRGYGRTWEWELTSPEFRSSKGTAVWPGEKLEDLVIRFAGHVARMGEKRNAYRILVGKTEGRRPLGRPRRRWVDDIKMDLREIGWDGVEWSGLD